jgi:hypothetical protein
MKSKMSNLLSAELEEHEYVLQSLVESRLNSSVYQLRYQAQAMMYGEVFCKSSCFRSIAGAHIMKKYKKIINEFGDAHDKLLYLPHTLDTRHFFVLIWKTQGFCHQRFNLVEYLKETELNDDDRWNLVSEIFRTIWNFARKGIYFKHLPFERIYIQGKKITVDAFEFMDYGKDYDPNNDETINHFLFEKYANTNNLSIIVPEIFLRRKLTAKSNSWIFGNLIFFVFEVQ